MAFARYAEGALGALPEALQESLPPSRLVPVLVAGEREARRAADLLEAQGYSVDVSPALPE